MKIEVAGVTDYGKIYDAINSHENCTQGIWIDLEKHGFFRPIGVLTLAQAIIFFIQKNIIVKIIPPKDKNAASYLRWIGIYEFCANNCKRVSSFSAIDKITAMPLCRIDTSTMDSYIHHAKLYFERFCKGKDLTLINTSISELINNAYDHSKSPTGAYVFCQYYKGRNIIRIAVADLGIGISGSVNKFLKNNDLPELNDKESILWALENKKSAMSQKHNRGYGLNTLKTFTEESKGNLRIISNGAFYYDGQIRNHSISSFRGTVVEVEIDIDDLPMSEMDNSFELW